MKHLPRSYGSILFKKAQRRDLSYNISLFRTTWELERSAYKFAHASLLNNIRRLYDVGSFQEVEDSCFEDM